jgi:hypothetical protein
MTNKAKLNQVLIEELGWELKLMNEREVYQYLKTLPSEVTAIFTERALFSFSSWMHRTPEIVSLEGAGNRCDRTMALHSWSIYITKEYTKEELEIINAHIMSPKRKNITAREKELRTKQVELKNDPWGAVIELRGWSERTPSLKEFNSPDYQPVRRRNGK